MEVFQKREVVPIASISSVGGDAMYMQCPDGIGRGRREWENPSSGKNENEIRACPEGLVIPLGVPPRDEACRHP